MTEPPDSLLSNIPLRIFHALAYALVIFYLWTAVVQPMGPQLHRGIYVGITYVLIFLQYPSKNRRLGALSDFCFALMGALAVGYWIVEYESLNLRAGAETDLDFWVSCIGVMVGMEAARRVLGIGFVAIGAVLCCYAIFGQYLPEAIQHGGFLVSEVFTFLFISTSGTFGIMADVLASYVILFIFFGAFLEVSGFGKFMLDLPLAMFGHRPGGPGKVSVVASALFGSISGSAIANTVSTGTFTIPLMKQAGFKPEVAGAIEPASSIGGMFLPPVMGAGGFIMAELLGIPYRDVMLVAVFPAILYFTGVFSMIHFEAKKTNIKGLAKEDLPQVHQVIKGWYLKIAPLIVVFALMLMGRSPGYAASFGIFAVILCSWFLPQQRMTLSKILQACQIGAKNTLMIGATIGVIGMIVGVIELTGVGLQFAESIIGLASFLDQSQFPSFLIWNPGEIASISQKLITVILVALASLLLGMGVPVTASYLIMAVLVVPAFHELGVALIAAHMIIYWLSQDSNITPPVCVAAYAGAAIAKSDPWQTGWIAFRYAKMLYVVPILLVFHPELVLIGTISEILLMFCGAFLGTVCFSAAIQGYLIKELNLLGRIAVVTAMLLCFYPKLLTLALGLAILLFIGGFQKKSINDQGPPA
ncbi:MAG: TRAP transporter fused permease subunit [Pseudobacteriovorax sp.]|nr:TRAP transporter fused permease subunit [Pseudobacteriovorax sp.]